MVWWPEGFLAAELGIIWKEHHGGPFEIRQCSRILSNVDFLELYVRTLEFEQESIAGRAIESSHLLLRQPGARLNADTILHVRRCLNEFNKGILGFTLNPRHVEIGALLVLLQSSNGSFRCKEYAKGPYTDGACPSVH